MFKNNDKELQEAIENAESHPDMQVIDDTEALAKFYGFLDIPDCGKEKYKNKTISFRVVEDSVLMTAGLGQRVRVLKDDPKSATRDKDDIYAITAALKTGDHKVIIITFTEDVIENLVKYMIKAKKELGN